MEQTRLGPNDIPAGDPGFMVAIEVDHPFSDLPPQRRTDLLRSVDMQSAHVEESAFGNARVVFHTAHCGWGGRRSSRPPNRKSCPSVLSYRRNRNLPGGCMGRGTVLRSRALRSRGLARVVPSERPPERLDRHRRGRTRTGNTSPPSRLRPCARHPAGAERTIESFIQRSASDDRRAALRP